MDFNANDVLDLSKENIQPRRQGRKTTQLRTADPDIRQMLMKQRDDFEHTICMYQGNDPLEPYHNYVTWLELNYTKIDRATNLVLLLEDILIKFKDIPKYKQDPRLIQILVQYISTQENPLELYQLVYDQGLGTMCSLLYKHWAEELNKVSDFKKADLVFQLGISSKAQPLKNLEDAHVQFQLGIARRMLEGDINIASQTDDSSTRNVLSRIPSTKTQNNRCSRESTGVLHAQNKIVKDDKFSQNQFQVYKEEIEDNIKSKVKNKNFHLSKYDVVDRENKMQAGSWYGVKQKQSRSVSTIKNSQFEIHEDLGGTYKVVKKADRAHALRTRKEFKCPVAVFEPPDPTKKAMYPKHLVYVGGRDIQLEEIRAAHILKLEQERKKETVEREVVPDEPINLTKSSNASSELSHMVTRPSPLTQPSLKRTYSDSNLSCRVINTEMSTYDQSWYLKTEFIQPVKPSQLVEFTTMQKYPSESRLSIESTVVKRKSEFMDIPKTEVAQKESERVHQRFEDEIFNFSNHSRKGGISTSHHSPSASFTVNTRAAMNVIQKMWESPLAPRCAKISKPVDDQDLFKLPVTRKSQGFKQQMPFFNEENEVPPSYDCTKPEQPFPVFIDKSNLYSSECPKSKEELVFPIYCEKETKAEIDIYARLSRRTSSRKTIEVESQLSDSMSSLKLCEELNPASVPLIVPVKLQDTPRRPENKENDPPDDIFIASERKPQVVVGMPNMPAYASNDEDADELFDETCSTKAFAVLLPSSTPFSKPDRSRRSRRYSIFNGSYTDDDAVVATNQPKISNYCSNISTNICRNPTNLSLILENSEHGCSSSGVNVPKPLS